MPRVLHPLVSSGQQNVWVHVAVGIVRNAAGEVLLTRRPDHVHQGGLWEFPGGKVETGETVEIALGRELREELGIQVRVARPLIRVRHAYPDKGVLLDVWCVAEYNGQPSGQEGQPLVWAVPQALPSYTLPAADRPIINAVRLPAEYLITGAPANSPERFLRRLERALQRGIALVQLRAKPLCETALLDLYQQAQVLGRRYGVPILLNGSPVQADRVNADGIHLSAARLRRLDRRPLPLDRWVAASCHDRAELHQACRIGVDFAVLSPVNVTASHSEATPIGWKSFQAWVAEANIPVYALGGMTPADLVQAWHHGAQGIAAIRAFWESE
jgi:8-oxo-dGTP diphosphatase